MVDHGHGGAVDEVGGEGELPFPGHNFLNEGRALDGGDVAQEEEEVEGVFGLKLGYFLGQELQLPVGVGGDEYFFHLLRK